MILFPVRGDHVDKGSNIPVFPECRKHDENLSSIQGPLESQLHTQHVHDYNPPEYPSKRRDLQIYLFKRRKREKEERKENEHNAVQSLKSCLNMLNT